MRRISFWRSRRLRGQHDTGADALPSRLLRGTEG